MVKSDTTGQEVALVITSCNRLHLLEKTIQSFLQFNTYPLSQKIIIEDSGKPELYKELQKNYGTEFEILFNEKPLGQAASIDRAYSQVHCPYIFHCEDDWEFYRPSFIEDSLVFLCEFPKLKQVLLRSIHHDYLVHHKTVNFHSEPLAVRGIRAYKSKMAPQFAESDWVTHSYNPGLIRRVDYERIGKYEGKTEAEISKFYKDIGFYSVALENDVILHLGWEESTLGHGPNGRNRQPSVLKKLRHKINSIIRPRLV